MRVWLLPLLLTLPFTMIWFAVSYMCICLYVFSCDLLLFLSSFFPVLIIFFLVFFLIDVIWQTWNWKSPFLTKLSIIIWLHKNLNIETSWQTYHLRRNEGKVFNKLVNFQMKSFHKFTWHYYIVYCLMDLWNGRNLAVERH